MPDEPTYYEADRSDLEPFVPAGVKRALDIGCASGTFGTILKKTGAEVWGIEPTEAAEKAKTRIDKVLHGTYREVQDQLPRAHFDLVCFTDVLEHMDDCFTVLREVRGLLAPNGQVLVSLPNLRHWPALMRLFWHGDFPYQDSGVFDRTHLRFFTKTSMVRMFTDCGYDISLCEGINPIVGPKLRLANFLTGGRFEDCAYLQYVIVASPKQDLIVPEGST